MAKPHDKRSESQRKSGSEVEYTGQTPPGKEPIEPNSEGGFVRTEGNKLTYNPLAIDEIPQPSPEQERLFEVNLDKGVAERLKQARAIGPSVRQQTQAEILNLVLAGRELGANPFSVRRIPFSIMRDMANDPTLSFALYYTETPLINATWSIECEDAQVAAAVDAAFRPINSDFKTKSCNKLRMGYQPLVKRWKLGKLDGKYRDKNSSNPEEDKSVWPSKNVDALLFHTPLALPPENCLPRWNEMGNFNGFMYSPVPIPNPMMLGVAQTYGPQVLSGYPIPLEWSMWTVNERPQVWGSLYGKPRTQRAYRYWWSFWYRWALADRSYENKADPAKIVYFPTMNAEGLDANNPDSESPIDLRNKAIQAGNNIRSGSTVAFPADFMENSEGKTTNQRQWEAKYMEGGENFNYLEQGFAALQTYMLRAMFLPEQAFIDATSAAQSSSQRYIAAQQGEIYQEAQQLLSNEDDEYVNKYMIPEFIAANFPEKAGIPCRKVTRKLRNPEFIKQLITLLGQKNPENLNVDIRALLEEEGVRTNSEAQQKVIEEKHKADIENSKPPITEPTKKEGVAGYNAGVEKTETGEHVYFQPGQELYLGADFATKLGIENRSFVDSLPKIPPYEDAVTRSAALQMRKVLMDRYKHQITSLASQIRNRTVLKLAEPKQEQSSRPGLGAGAARAAAGGAVAAWLSDQALTTPAAAKRLKEILSRIAAQAGKKELKLANLDTGVYDPSSIEQWVNKYTDENLNLMDHTTQDVFKDFLEKQLQQNSHPEIVAQTLEDHFAEMPITYAARAVRAMTRDSYNEGMLQAAEDAGIDQVMAHDASEGTNLNTDKKCINRNGKVYSIKDARKETEHPNGTLHWSYLTTSNLSVRITDDIPDSLELSDNMMAGYDVNSEILYIRNHAKESENKYLLALGERLKYR